MTGLTLLLGLFMAYLNICGFEMEDDDTDTPGEGIVELDNWSGTGTGVTFGNTNAHFSLGQCCDITCPADATSIWVRLLYQAQYGGSYPDPTFLYTTFWFRVTTLPASSSEEFFSVTDSTDTTKIHLRLKSDGAIELYDTSGTIIGTSSTTLSTDTYYFIGVYCTIGSTGDTCKVEIAESNEITGTNKDVGSNNPAKVIFGRKTSRNNLAYQVQFDDVALNDTDYAPEGRVTVLLPNAAGNYTDWTGDYTAFDVDPPDGTTITYDGTGSPAVAGVESFNLDNTAGAHISGNIYTVKSSVEAQTSANDAYAQGIRVSSNDYHNADAITTGQYYHLATVFDQNPNTVATWTTAGVDGTEVYLSASNGTGLIWTAIAMYVSVYHDSPDPAGAYRYMKRTDINFASRYPRAALGW